MKPRSGAFAAGIVFVFAVAVVDAGVLATLAPPTAAQTALGVLDRLTEFVRGLDQFLEAVLDLVRTFSSLFGGEGGD
ncbi:hypothetical protein C474_04780 [Halogeometricum pallidum JCM 14848]|uniref:Uncharacterized protein n=1 Tax=Halogeometricum pallidum JCM 14848 TaxID=1227487 RepID=M0DD00_HALPD|nr:hypothetical protein [Halogeometricum pallidum]ELZ33366.1 hypothetical protein C474_04780 [Halogeometricum pallidum JCM 14848]